MPEISHRQRRSWSQKFGAAFRGSGIAIRDHHSFWAHLLFAVAVLVAAAMRQVAAWQWCLVLVCVTSVFVAEMLNTALEVLSRAVDSDFNPHIRDALDIGSAAVLMAAIGAVAVGLVVFLI